MTTAAPQRVAIARGATSYQDRGGVCSLVQSAIQALGLPSDFVRSGDRVVLKPNWVKEHDERTPGPNAWEHVVTHPAVIEGVARWAAAQMAGSGQVIICDAPQTDSSFARLRQYCGLDGMIRRLEAEFPGVRFELLDLRPEEWHAVDGVTVSKMSLAGDPMGSTKVALDDASEFVGFRGEGQLYGASYDMAETNAHHHGTRHEYMLCRTPMEADVFINIPKLKTHKKVGLTCALKNLVGINANKNWLPHHTEGTPEAGGDQFPAATAKARLEHSLMGTAKRWLKNRPLLSRAFIPMKKLGRMYFGDTQEVVRSGNWHGNDTCWRMVVDLNKCLFFFDGEGKRRTRLLRYLAVVDGIIGGEGNGPMAPDAKACGVILAGSHPLAVDCAAATIMGFNWRKLRLLTGAYDSRPVTVGAAQARLAPFRAQDLEIVDLGSSKHPTNLEGLANTFQFKPHFGWVGAIEKETRSVTA